MAWRAPAASSSPSPRTSPFPQHNVAATFAMDRARHCELREPRAKALRCSQRARVQLRIAAGQPATVAALGGRLVGERRERNDVRAGAPPTVENVRVDEGEGRVGCE